MASLQIYDSTGASTATRGDLDSAKSPLKVAVLVSGNGSNLQVLIDAMRSGDLPIQIVGVISNVKDAFAITRAEQAGIETAVLSHITSGDNIGKRMGIKSFERHATIQLQEWQPDLIVLAGFMRVLSPEFIDAAPAPMINLHPSLLPNYKGLDTHSRVLQAGERHHGCSVHVVTAELDAGQVLTQALLPVSSGDTADTLKSRVQKLEHQLLPWTILMIASKVIPASVFTAISPEQVATSDAADTSFLPALPLKLWLDK